MIFFRRRKKQPKVTVTPENLAELFQQDKVTPFERRVFSQVIKQSEKRAAAARELLMDHRRDDVVPIPESGQDAVLQGVGLRRSFMAFLLFGLPLIAVGLMAYHHTVWGLTILGVAVAGVIISKLWDGHQLGRMVLAEVELKALRAIATADPTAREVFIQWKKDPLPFTQRDFQVVENWVGSLKEMNRWLAVQGLLAQNPDRKTRRIYGRR
jgi:hypothetical protein